MITAKHLENYSKYNLENWLRIKDKNKLVFHIPIEEHVCLNSKSSDFLLSGFKDIRIDIVAPRMSRQIVTCTFKSIYD